MPFTVFWQYEDLERDGHYVETVEDDGAPDVDFEGDGYHIDAVEGIGELDEDLTGNCQYVEDVDWDYQQVVGLQGDGH